MSSEKKFDLHNLHVQLTSVYEKSPKLDMDAYINAYAEFNKYFNSTQKKSYKLNSIFVCQVL